MAGLHALLVGIDGYQGPRPLAGCVNDIAAIQRVLLERVTLDSERIPPSRIRILIAPRAEVAATHGIIGSDTPTRENILAALASLAGPAVEPGDRVFIYFSGHGTQLTVAGSHRFMREAILPVDTQRPGSTERRYIFDWELNAALRNISARTAAVTMVLDCCSAAGAVRDGLHAKNGASRFHETTEPLAPAVTEVAPERAPGGIARAIAGPVDGVMVVAACLDDEQARESSLGDGLPHGVLTRALLRALDGIQDAELGELRWSTIWRDVEAVVAELGPAQHPWVSSSLQRRVFGGCPELADAGYALSRDADLRVVRIHAGTLAGITPGAEIAVYGAEPAVFPAAGSTADDAARHLTLRVTRVTDRDAWAELEAEPPGGWPRGARGRLTKPGQAERLVVAVPPQDTSLAVAIAASPLLALAGEAQPEVTLVRFADGRWGFTDDVHGANEPGAPELPARSGDPAAVVRLTEHYARYIAPVRFARRCSDLPDALSVSLLDCNQVADPLAPDIAQDPALVVLAAGRRAPYELRAGREDDGGGDRFCIRIESRHTATLFVTVLNSDSDGAVALVADRIQLSAGARAVLWHPSGLGVPFRAVLTEGRDLGIDRFVFIATTDRTARLDHLTLHGTFASALAQVRNATLVASWADRARYTASLVTLRLERSNAAPGAPEQPLIPSELGAGLAVVIGISAYGDDRDLRNAANDAHAIGQRLERDQGFVVRPLYDGDATLGAIRTVLGELPQLAHDYARIVIYFAGHGLTALQGDRVDAKLVPYGSQVDDPDTLLPMAEVRQACERVAAAADRKRHVLLLLDCCAAGALTARRVTAPEQPLYHERYYHMLGHRGVQFIGAAAHDQYALDQMPGVGLQQHIALATHRRATQPNDAHSPFATALLAAFTRAGGDGRSHPVDDNHDGVFLASELYAYVREQLYRWGAPLARYLAQNPVYSTLDGDEGGDLVFVASRRRVRLPLAEKLSVRLNPYRGSAPYADCARDELLLFGRSNELDALDQHIDEHAITVVTGRSRSGKTSLLEAGLIRRRRTAGWEIRRVVPGQPVPALDLEPATRRLIVVDPLEALGELSPAQASQFLLGLEQLSARRPEDRIVAALRSGEGAVLDTRASIGSSPRWSAWPLQPMTSEQLSDAIEGPAESSVLFFTDERAPQQPPRSLVQTLLAEVAGMPDALALLSTTLHAMVASRVGRPDRYLTWDDYEAATGAREAGIGAGVARRAEAVYDEAPAEIQAMMIRIFVRLMAVDDRGVRRVALPADRIGAVDGRELAQAALLDQLDRARLIVRGDVVELSHDALLTAWPRIAALVEQRGVLQVYADLASRAAGVDGAPLQDAPGWRQVARVRKLAPPPSSLAERLAERVAPTRMLERIQRHGPVALSSAEGDFILRGARRQRNVVLAVMVLLVGGGLTVTSVVGAARSARRETATLRELDVVRAAAREAQQSPRDIERRVATALDAIGDDTVHAPELPGAFLDLAQARANSPVRHITASGDVLALNLAGDRLTAVVRGNGTLQVIDGPVDAAPTPYPIDADAVDPPAVAISPGGALFAYESSGTVRLWNIAAKLSHGVPIVLQEVDADRDDVAPKVWGLAFSADGARLAVAFGDRSLDVWDLRDPGNPTRVMPTQKAEAAGMLAIDPAGAHVLAAAAHETWQAVVIDVTTREATSLDGFGTTRATAAAFSSDGKRLAIGSTEGVGLWSFESGTPKFRRVLDDLQGNLSGLAFSDDGEHLAGATIDGDAVVWSMRAGMRGDTSMRFLVGDRASVHLLAFGGDSIAAAGRSAGVEIWKVERPVALDVQHGGAVTALAVAPDEHWLASGSVDRTARVWNATTGEPSPKLARALPITALAATESWLAVGGMDRRIELARPQGEVIARFGDQRSPIIALAISPSGLIASASADGTVDVYDRGGVRRNRFEHECQKPGDDFSPDEADRAVTAVTWLNDRELASAGNDRRIKIWSLDTGAPARSAAATSCDHPELAWSRLLATGINLPPAPEGRDLTRDLPNGAPVRTLAWSPEAQRLLSTGADGSATLWVAGTWRPISLVGHRGAVVAGRFSADGNSVVTAADDGTARVWKADNGTLRAVYDGRAGPLRDAVLAPRTCGRLATAGEDGVVRVWSTASGRELVRFAAHGGAATRVEFLDGGRRIASAGADGHVRTYPTCADTILGKLCKLRDLDVSHRRCPVLEEEPCCLEN